jgi:hypothetical protein
MDLPNIGDDEFDQEIANLGKSSMPEGPSALVLMFMEVRESFLAMVEAGFTEAQALRFHAYCAISEGDF